MRSNGWDDVTSALQLLSHLDGDAPNVALLVLEFQRKLSGVLVKSLSEHYGSPGRLAEYKCQFERAFRGLGDDPSVFAIELETLARRAFVDIDSSVQLQMVRDCFMDGQAECALHRHLDSLGPDTQMRDIADSCRVWESHIEVASSRQVRLDRHSPRSACQVTASHRLFQPGQRRWKKSCDGYCRSRRCRLFHPIGSCSYSACWGPYCHLSR